MSSLATEGFKRLFDGVKKKIMAETDKTTIVKEASEDPTFVKNGIIHKTTEAELKKASEAQNDMVILKNSNIHGLGLSATRDIPPNTYVIQYIGPIVDSQYKATMTAYEKRYLFKLDDEYSIDGSPLYNLARYINHKCSDNNCTIEHKFEDGRKQIWVVSQRFIKDGEELTYSYGRRYWSGQRVCQCGSAFCFGRKAKGDSDSDASE